MNFLSNPTNLILIVLALGSAGLLLWPKLSSSIGVTSIGTLDLTQLINGKNALVLDVRSAEDFASGSITGARNIPIDAIAARLSELTRFKSKPVVVVCQRGVQSGKAAQILQKEGFTEVYNLTGGLAAWQQAGLPLVPTTVKPGNVHLVGAGK